MSLRVRMDFSVDRAKCAELSQFNHSVDHGPCNLPEDCERCRRFTCNACERSVGYDFGCADGAPGICDDCWVKYIEPWEEAELALQHRKNNDAYRDSLGRPGRVGQRISTAWPFQPTGNRRPH